MKLIDFAKIGEHFEKTLHYRGRRTRSLRATIVSSVFEAIVTGFFLGVTLQDYLRGRSALSWIFPLGIAFTAALTTLRDVVVALRLCPRPAKTAGEKPHFTTPGPECVSVIGEESRLYSPTSRRV